jgi:hypothetical protein
MSIPKPKSFLICLEPCRLEKWNFIRKTVNLKGKHLGISSAQIKLRSATIEQKILK